MRTVFYLSCFLFLTIFLGSCSDSSDRSSKPNPYAADALWMCKPDLDSNPCLELDQTATLVYSDSSQAVFEHTPAADPTFDCFYVYGTVDLSEEPGNTDDLTNVEPALESVYNQAARFNELCNLYAPLYRQMTLGTYRLEEGVGSTEYYDIAAADINDAFSQYLKESGKRPFVLMGHSQGAAMVLELLEHHLETDAQLRQRLISALPIGANGARTQNWTIMPDSFDNIPLCEHATQTGCIITYNSIVAGDHDRVAESRPCVDPTRLGGNPGILAYDMWWEGILPLPREIETPFAGQPELYTANCEADRYLGIGVIQGDDRKPFIPPEAIQLVTGGTLHVSDFNYAMGDLLRIIATQAENMP